MPRYAELADGRRLEFPDETSDAVIQSTVKRIIATTAPPTPPIPMEYPLPTPQDKGALGRGIDILQRSYGSAVEGAGKVLGLEGLEEYGADIALQNEYELQQQAQFATRLKDVKDVSSGLSYYKDVLLENVPQLGTTMSAIGAGTLAAGLPGGLAAGIAVNIPYFYGSNREAQKEAGAVEVDEGAAFLASIPQATLDTIFDRILLGGRLFTPKAVGGGGLFTRSTKGATVGAIAEVPTEVGQQVIERYQAGLPIDNEEALNEYKEVAVAAGLVGGTVKGTTTALGGDVAAREKAEKEAARLAEERRLASLIDPETGQRELDFGPDFMPERRTTDTDIETEADIEEEIQSIIKAQTELETEEDADTETVAKDERQLDFGFPEPKKDKKKKKEEAAEKETVVEEESEVDVQEDVEEPEPAGQLDFFGFNEAEKNLQSELEETIGKKPEEDVRTTTVTNEELDGLGIRKAAPLRKRLVTGEPIAIDTVERELTNYANNEVAMGNETAGIKIRANINDFITNIKEEVVDTQQTLDLPKVVGAKEQREKAERIQVAKELAEDFAMTEDTLERYGVIKPDNERRILGKNDEDRLKFLDRPRSDFGKADTPTKDDSIQYQRAYHERLQKSRQKALDDGSSIALRNHVRDLNPFYRTNLGQKELDALDTLDLKRIIQNNFAITDNHIKELDTFLETPEAKAKLAEDKQTQKDIDELLSKEKNKQETEMETLLLLAEEDAETVVKAEQEIIPEEGTTVLGGAVPTEAASPNISPKALKEAQDAGLTPDEISRIEETARKTNRKAGVRDVRAFIKAKEFKTKTEETDYALARAGVYEGPIQGREISVERLKEGIDKKSPAEALDWVINNVRDPAYKEEAKKIKAKIEALIKVFGNTFSVVGVLDTNSESYGIETAAGLLSTLTPDKEVYQKIKKRIKTKKKTKDKKSVFEDFKDFKTKPLWAIDYPNLETIPEEAFENDRDISLTYIFLRDSTGNLIDDASQVETLLHELLHATTAQAIRFGADISRIKFDEGKMSFEEQNEFRNLYSEAQNILKVVRSKLKILNERDLSLLTPEEFAARFSNLGANVDELFAWSGSNRDVAKWLDSIPYEGNVSIFSKIINTVRKFFNISNEASDTALAKILVIKEELLDPKMAVQEFEFYKNVYINRDPGFIDLYGLDFKITEPEIPNNIRQELIRIAKDPFWTKTAFDIGKFTPQQLLHYAYQEYVHGDPQFQRSEKEVISLLDGLITTDNKKIKEVTGADVRAKAKKWSKRITTGMNLRRPNIPRIINFTPPNPVPPKVVDSLLDGNLKQAMDRLAKTASNNRLKEIANALKNVVGNTKIEIVNNLSDNNGVKVLGLFDPKTNTIKLDSQTGLNEHTLLHEMTHAAVSASLANKGLPSTAKLNTLYQEVKDKLTGVYQIDTLDEFVSEVFSNTQMVQELGTVFNKDSDITILQRLHNILTNFIRNKIQGAKVKPVVDAGAIESLSELDNEILNILAVAPEYRDAGQLLMASKNGTINKVANKIGKVLYEGGKARNEQTVGQATGAAASFIGSTAPKWLRMAISKTMPSGSLAELLKARYKTNVGERVGNAVQEAVSASGKAIKRLDATKQSVGGWLAQHPELARTFDFVVHASTLFRVDPTKPREYYSQYFLLDTQTDKRTGFNSRKERDDEMFRLNDLYEKAAKQKGKDKPKKKIVKSDGNPNENTLLAYDRVVKEFNKLKEQGGDKAYIELRGTYRKLFENLETAMNDLSDNLTTEEGADVAAAVKLNLKQTVLKQLFASAKIDPYFPLTRTGNYWLRFDIEGMSDPVVESYTSPAARERARVEYNKDDRIKNISVYNGSDALSDSFIANAPTAGFMGQAMQILKAGKVDPKLQKQFLQLYINALPESSALKALKSRKDVLGFNTSAMDAFEQTAYNMGRQVASVTESKNLYNVLRESLEEVKEIDVRSRDIDTRLNEAERRGDTAAVEQIEKEKEKGYFNLDEAQIISDRLQEDVEFITKPPSGPLEDWPALANRLTFLWTLGANISSVIVNTGNLAVMVLPYLSGKTGVGIRGATRAMSAGSRLFVGSGTDHRVRNYLGDKEVDVEQTKLIGNSIDNYYEADDNGNLVLRKDVTGLDDPFYKMKNKDGSFKTMTKKEFLEMIMPLVQQADDFGMLNRSMFADTFNASETLIKEGDSNPIKDFNLNSVTGISALPFHTAERYARQTTLVASFLAEMERITNNPSEAKGETDLSSSEKINAAIQQAMYDTSRTNGGHVIATAPPLARKNIFRSALMFKTFGIQMLITQIMTTMEIFKGADSAAKRQAFKQIMGIQGATLLFAGAAGNTLFGWAAMFYNAFRDEDEDEDFETLTRKVIGELAYKGGIYGLTESMGAGIDISERIGLANMVIGNGKYNFNDTWESDLVALLLGPSYGTAGSVIRGFGQIAEGNISRGIEDASPTALRSMIRAIRFGTEGAKSRRGDFVMDDSSFSSGQLAAQFFGFMPAEYSRQMTLRQVGKEMDVATLERKSKISSKLGYALKNNLSVEDILKEISEFNEAHPEDPIDVEYLERSLAAQEQRTLAMVNGVTISPSRRRMVQDLIDDTSFYPVVFK